MNHYMGEYTSFDEHIAYVESLIADNQKCINECIEENKDFVKEIEQVKQDKENFLKNGTYKPSINLEGISETKKKLQIYEWCKKHELIYHKDLVGNYWKKFANMSEKQPPEYEFISAMSDTSKIRYVRCINCYKNEILNNNAHSHSQFELED